MQSAVKQLRDHMQFDPHFQFEMGPLKGKDDERDNDRKNGADAKNARNV
jgi:hypothetical protein